MDPLQLSFFYGHRNLAMSLSTDIGLLGAGTGTFTVTTGTGSRFLPFPGNGMRAIIWAGALNSSPIVDSFFEVVWISAISADTLTLSQRGLPGGSTPTTHNGTIVVANFVLGDDADRIEAAINRLEYAMLNADSRIAGGVLGQSIRRCSL